MPTQSPKPRRADDAGARVAAVVCGLVIVTVLLRTGLSRPPDPEPASQSRHGVQFAVTSRAAAAAADVDKGEFGVPGARVPGPRLIVATRYWAADARDLHRLEAFLSRALQFADHVLVGVRVEADHGDTMRFIASKFGDQEPRVTGVALQPYLYYTTGLNSLAILAAHMGATYILFHSMDLVVAPATVRCIVRFADDRANEAFIVGGATPHHTFAPGQHAIMGVNAPWNTFALWHLPSLMRVGFVPVSDATVPGVGGAIEESLAMSLMQHLHASGPKRGSGPVRVRDGAQDEDVDSVINFAALRSSAAATVSTAAERARIAQEVRAVRRHEFLNEASAAESGAAHWRWRAYLAALPNATWQVPGLSAQEQGRTGGGGSGASAVDADGTSALPAAVLEQRRQRHWQKIRTKALRARQQHWWAGVPHGIVDHVEIC